AVDATLVWLPVAVTGAWTAAIAFYLGYGTAFGRSSVSSGALAASTLDTIHGGHESAAHAAHAPDMGPGTTAPDRGVVFNDALKPLAWAFALAVQAMVWMAGGVSLKQLPELWQVDALATVIIAVGVLLPVVCAWAVL